MLRLIELYVLWSIGELSLLDHEIVSEMEPELRRVFAGGDSWHSAIAIAMDLPCDASEQIMAMWVANQDSAKSSGRTLTPQEFAEAFADRLIE